MNPTAQICTLPLLLQVTVDGGIVFPLRVGDGLRGRREPGATLERGGGRCFIRLSVLSFFITIPATGPVWGIL